MINDQEESERYLSIAQKYLLNDDHRNALKYLYKSQQSFPSNYVKEMIGKVEQLILVSEENGRFESKLKYEYLCAKQQTSQKTQTNGTECDDNDNGDDSDSENRISNKAEYSEDQLEAVRRINSYKDYYQILNLTKDANEQDLKRQYRRLALQFHPDKNKAPGASDAFKAISSAFEVLGDPEKRRNYDLYGSAERIPKKQTNIYSEYSARFNRDRNMSSEELFNLFFGDTHVYGARHQWSADRTESQESSGISVFIQLLPVIVFVIMSIISSLLIRDPIYSLSRSTKYPYLRKTSDLHIPYFVKENFEADFKSSLREIEEEVNQDFIRDLKTRCFKERNYRENLIWKAKNIGDATFEERARRMKTPSCSELHELQKRVDDNI